jgi:hypothetical protein
MKRKSSGKWRWRRLNYGANYGGKDREFMLTGRVEFTAADDAQRQIP